MGKELERGLQVAQKFERDYLLTLEQVKLYADRSLREMARPEDLQGKSWVQFRDSIAGRIPRPFPPTPRGAPVYLTYLDEGDFETYQTHRAAHRSSFSSLELRAIRWVWSEQQITEWLISTDLPARLRQDLMTDTLFKEWLANWLEAQE